MQSLSLDVRSRLALRTLRLGTRVGSRPAHRVSNAMRGAHHRPAECSLTQSFLVECSARYVGQRPVLCARRQDHAGRDGGGCHTELHHTTHQQHRGCGRNTARGDLRSWSRRHRGVPGMETRPRAPASRRARSHAPSVLGRPVRRCVAFRRRARSNRSEHARANRGAGRGGRMVLASDGDASPLGGTIVIGEGPVRAHGAWPSSRRPPMETGRRPPFSRRACRAGHIHNSTRASEFGRLALHTERLV